MNKKGAPVLLTGVCKGTYTQQKKDKDLLWVLELGGLGFRV